MEKKDLLFIYPSMIIGGSTTALLSLLNNLDKEKYNIHLQLYRNEGPLLDMIPSHVTLLPAAERYRGKSGRLWKGLKLLFSGHFFRALFGTKGKAGGRFARGVLLDFQAKHLSRRCEKHYDCAIGYLENWSDRYLAFQVKADQKFAWLHSTFRNITDTPKYEIAWMKRVDKIVFVTDACKENFKEEMPAMAEKAITVANITDSEVIRQRSLSKDPTDEALMQFLSFSGLRLITVCRLDSHVKGLDRIVLAARKMKETGQAFLWFIVGDGEDRALLGRMIEEAKLADCLIPIGKRYNPYPFIAAADAMCMPSRFEGKPVTVTESMILGTPPIVTSYLSAREQIEDGWDGIVTENTDEGILPPLLGLLEDKAPLVKMKANLKKRDYGNTDYITETEKILFGGQ